MRIAQTLAPGRDFHAVASTHEKIDEVARGIGRQFDLGNIVVGDAGGSANFPMVREAYLRLTAALLSSFRSMALAIADFL